MKTLIIRDKDTKKAVAELSCNLVADHALNPKYEAVPVIQHLSELNMRCTKALAEATI